MTVRIPVRDLSAFAVSVLRRCGLADSAAEAAASAFCYADTCGLSSFGVDALAVTYVPRLLDGRIDPTAAPAVVQDTGTCAVLDGRRGLGSVTMTVAIDIAGCKARQHGLGAVAVRNSTDFGCAGYYTKRLARFGLVGVAMSNMLGTNPLSAAVPAGTTSPFVLDMSATGHGLALLVDLLCGPLTGAGDSNVGHLALAIDPSAFGPADRFASAARDILTTVESCPTPTYPGAPEARQAADSAIAGVALSDAVAADLYRLADQLDVPLPTPLRQAEPLRA